MKKVLEPALITVLVYVVWFVDGLSVGFTQAQTPEEMFEQYYRV